ncbi:helix-turn-helix domain-containing protein, partial [Photobacterium halotolerans]|uniref:helix-turn-helix domain-containing protein n=1 Tax=Photobacterium halotolerans TaxID=265726 RepID=UPI001373276A
MDKLDHKLLTPNYLTGRDFTSMLLKANQVSTHRELSEIYGIPASTISTWHQCNRASHEVTLRTALHNPRINLRALALGEGELFCPEHSPAQALPVYSLVNGSKLLSNSSYIDAETISRFGLTHSKTEVIEISGVLHFVDLMNNDPFSGRFLIFFDGRYSINKIQRLPGKKLSVAFSDTPT